MAEAKKNGKTVIAFTHYPMVDFNDGATLELKSLLGEKKWQMERVPEEEVAKAFAEAGLQIHFAGHMHINDTGIRNVNGRMLVNIQVPSLAAYIPAYKVLTIHSQDKMEVQTEVLNNVPRFDELFPLYEKEYNVLQKDGSKPVWNKDILKSASYHEFMLFHLKELVRLRMIPDDWPKDFIEHTKKFTGEDLLLLVQTPKQLQEQRINSEAFQKWKIEDLLLDLYKFQSADELARKDIPDERLQQYKILEELFSAYQGQNLLVLNLKKVFKIMSLLSNGDPADHFEINLKKNSVIRL